MVVSTVQLAITARVATENNAGLDTFALVEVIHQHLPRVPLVNYVQKVDIAKQELQPKLLVLMNTTILILEEKILTTVRIVLQASVAQTQMVLFFHPQLVAQQETFVGLQMSLVTQDTTALVEL
jgi:hypothetical protein